MSKYLFELQNKFILLIITFCSTLLVCYYYKDVLLFLVTQMHLNDKSLYFIFTDVTELLSIYFKLVFFVLVQTIVWYLFYHIFTFLRPAFYSQELKFLTFCFNSVTFFWITAGCLSSYILIPFSWNFFLSFQVQEGFYFEARINDYFNFYINVYLLCLTYCQLFTLLLFFFADVKKNYTYIKKYRKLYYYMFLIFSTLVTPPDLLSQFITTILLVLIYEIMILLLIFNFFYKPVNLVTN